MAFAKEDPRILTVTIDENGDMIYLKTPLSDVLLELGTVVTKRASHVEPATFWLRQWFHIVRACVRDNSRVAQWTRGWKCLWRINTKPVGGPILTHGHVTGFQCKEWVWDIIALYPNRQDAIDAEIIFLNKFFLTR